MQFGFKAIQLLWTIFQPKPCSTSWTSKLRPVVPHEVPFKGWPAYVYSCLQLGFGNHGEEEAVLKGLRSLCIQGKLFFFSF